MSQLSLNLIAITIFTLVMSALLGPLFHLSPAIPAIATFGILSIATLDTLSWQGRGGSLLLDWVANFSADHRDRVLHHEAGHFLAAHVLNIPVSGYSLSTWDAWKQGQPGRGGVQFDTTTLAAEFSQKALSDALIDRYCTVWMAGMAAEMLVYGNAEGGEDDRQTISLLWAQLQRSPAQAALKQRWASLQAKTLLEERWPAYEALVEGMRQRLPVATCKAIIQQQQRSSDPGGSSI